MLEKLVYKSYKVEEETVWITRTINDACRKLKKRHIKNTPQRQVILAYLMSSKEHPSIEMIYSYVKENGFSVSLATVYNTLELFMDKS